MHKHRSVLLNVTAAVVLHAFQHVLDAVHGRVGFGVGRGGQKEAQGESPGVGRHLQAAAGMPGIGMKPGIPFMRSIQRRMFGYGARSMPPSPAMAV